MGPSKIWESSHILNTELLLSIKIGSINILDWQSRFCLVAPLISAVRVLRSVRTCRQCRQIRIGAPSVIILHRYLRLRSASAMMGFSLRCVMVMVLFQFVFSSCSNGALDIQNEVNLNDYILN